MSNLFPSIGNKKDDNLEKIIDKPLFHTIEYELTGIVDKIKNINNFNEKEIKEIIIRQHSMILNYDNFLSSKESRNLALELFTNEKFLICFLDVIRILELSEHERICVNKLAYDYYSLSNKNQEIVELLFQLTAEINSKEVLILSSIIGISDAKILAMIKNSSFKEAKCVQRVNSFLVKYNRINLTLNNMINIYCYLFNHVTTLFVETMMEAKPANLSEYEERNFDTISIAILEIINSMPSSEIKKVINSYAFTLSTLQQNTIVRFSLKTAVRYERIIRVVKEVELENCGIYAVKIP